MHLMTESRVGVAAVILLGALGAFAAKCPLPADGSGAPQGGASPEPCEVKAVVKPVKTVRREITVTIVGEERPAMPQNRRPTVDACFAYWKRSMDRELPNRPDLMVLPEGVDSWRGMSSQEKLEWCNRRGRELIDRFVAYAREHRMYLVFNSARVRSDGDLCNTTYMLDRDGDCIAVYDKYYPAPIEIWQKALTIRPGDEVVTAETDFGRVAFITCFDINFRDYIEKIREKKPDVICYCSAFDGSTFWRKAVSYTCRAYMVAATTGPFAKAITGPCGEDIAHQHNYGYWRTFSQKINTNCRVVHMGMHWKHLEEAVRRYGPDVTVRNPGNVGACTLISNRPDRPIDDIIAELGIEIWDRYYARSVATRLDALASAHPGAIVFENSAARLILGTNGVARSLKLKATGQEMLRLPSTTPFASVVHARPYDKIAQLKHPAQERVFYADRMSFEDGVLKIGFAGTRDFLRVGVAVKPDRFEFSLLGTGIEAEEFGPKWTWAPDACSFARFTFARRAHFGEWMNTVWDAASAAALMGATPETRASADLRDNGDLTLQLACLRSTGTDGAAGALIAAATTNLLDAVDSFERDNGLPLGAAMRRSPMANASYYWASGVTPANFEEHLAAAKKGGFPLFMISYTAFASTCGHFVWRDSYPGKEEDLARMTERLRSEGILPGLHFHYSKVSRDDPYVSGPMPDARMNTVSASMLAADVGADAAELPLQARPAALNMEDGRRLLLVDREWIEFGGVSVSAPWRLTGCRRGCLGSKAAAHAASSTVRHVDVDTWTRFIRVDADSAIADEIAQRLGEIYSCCGFRFAYFDGAEDVPEPYWYQVSKAQKRVWDRLSPAPVAAETYVRNHFGWHMFSRGNAFDPYPPGKTREAYFKYQLPCMREARENFTTVDLGWMDVKPGRSVEEYEFMADRAREWNAPLALWTSVEALRAHPDAARILDVFRRLNDERRR